MNTDAHDQEGDEAEISYSLFKLEPRNAPMLPRPLFYRRAALGAVIGFGLLSIALFAGMLGYHVTEHLSWLDSFVNAAMILGGMGPVAPVVTNAGKLFAGCYALFSGLAFITIAGVMLAPFVHRVFHCFHLTDDSAGEKD
ncbi:MAG TPA: hypothetical protein VK815_12410 [Candidatus Acidoferrales bacterium]|nr:hypothetical protein [Candidatus Acidoferrales bacterium]